MGGLQSHGVAVVGDEGSVAVSVPRYALDALDAEVWPAVERAHALVTEVHRAEVARLEARIRELEAKLARKRRGKR